MTKTFLLIGLMVCTAACGGDPDPNDRCMQPTEVGVVKTTGEWMQPGFRGGDIAMTTVVVEVKGVGRVCTLQGHASKLLQPGSKVSLIKAQRAY